MKWKKKDVAPAVFMHTIIIDVCPKCAKKVRPHERQELEYMTEHCAFGRVCGECLDQEGRVCLAGPQRIS